jgi:hypothetical protein
MKVLEKRRGIPVTREELEEAYEIRAFRDEMDEPRESELINLEIAHAEAGAIQAIKTTLKGHGEQTVLPAVRR